MLDVRGYLVRSLGEREAFDFKFLLQVLGMSCPAVDVNYVVCFRSVQE